MVAQRGPRAKARRVTLDRARRELVIFTTNHPFTHSGGETMFVGPELPHLVRAFGRTRVVPLHDGGTQLSMPEAVELDRSLATAWRAHRLRFTLLAWRWPGIAAELRRGWRHGGWVGAVRVWRWAAVALASWEWLRERVRDDAPVLLYSYWRGGQTLAIARWAALHGEAGAVAVTRVHRYELYDEAFDPPFQPWTAVYASLRLVVPVARQGADYLIALGIDPSRVRVARLGVPAGPRARVSTDGMLRVLSCSTVTEVKRVERIARALGLLAARHPSRRIEWTHYGDGPRMPAVHAVLAGVPSNLQAKLPGRVDHDRVLAHYSEQPVDLLLLTSRSEGLPVAIQEALAHGVPVVATDVGGVAEAVDRSGDNGALLPADASPDVVAAAVEALWLADAETVTARRDAAHRRWAADFDAEHNHAALAAALADC
jgi:colanic acid/amylovoran biosynthesis glycosyltransferase